MKTLKAYFVLGAAAAALSLGVVSSASATIAQGDVIEIQSFNPDLSTPVDVPPASTIFAPPSVELQVYQNSVDVIIDPNQIILTQLTWGGYAPAAFNGLEITDQSNSNAFLGWTAQPGGAPWPFDEYQSGGSIFINWQGVAAAGYDQLVLAPGPIPGAGLAGLAALALAGLHARKRRA